MGRSYRQLQYDSCPCRYCLPSTRPARRRWKRLLHKSARQQARRDIGGRLADD